MYPPTKDNPKPGRSEWTPKDEERFVDMLYQDLDKVHTKQKVKAMEFGGALLLLRRRLMRWSRGWTREGQLDLVEKV